MPSQKAIRQARVEDEVQHALKQTEDNHSSSHSEQTSLSNVILYDGVCNLCWFWVQFILKHDKKRLFHFVPLQSQTAVDIMREHQLNPAELTTVVLINEKDAFTKSSAILRALRKLPMPWPLLYGFSVVPRFVRDRLYSFIGKNRYRWFGRGEACYLPDKDDQDRFL